MVMIRVVITGPAVEGRFNYRIETEGTRLAAPLTGLAAAPLLDACRRLKDMDAASPDATVGLFDEVRYRDQWRMRTQVGYGAKMTAAEGGGPPKLAPYQPMTPEALAARQAATAHALKSSEGTETAPEAEKRTGEPGEIEGGPTGGPPAISEAPPLLPKISPEPPADTGPAEPRRAKPAHPPRKRKPIASGGRRGRR